MIDGSVEELRNSIVITVRASNEEFKNETLDAIKDVKASLSEIRESRANGPSSDDFSREV